MTQVRRPLPQLGEGLFLTDGGIETTLIFREGLSLPDFAAFHLLKTPEGKAALVAYFRAYCELAKRFSTGLILESATWRASSDWGSRLGYAPRELAGANQQAVLLLADLRAQYETSDTKVVVSGCVGPRGDGYSPAQVMSEGEAEAYHREQIAALADSEADMICAITMTYPAEAVGIARAAQRLGLPAAISFTVETDGRLPTGERLDEAIALVDAATSGYPSYYMINCAHPAHFEDALLQSAERQRVRGFRANASRKSHAELNESPVLDAGDPSALAQDHARLKRRLSHVTVMGGCCGTDERHVASIAEACLPLFRSAR